MSESSGDGENKSREGKNRLRELGMQCVSPGFGKMDNRMLSTLQISKDIAKEQKEAIQKLGGDTKCSSPEPKNNAGSDTAPSRVSGHDSGSSSAGDIEKNVAKAGSKSLKRARIPPPLNIRASGSDSGLRSGKGDNFQFTGARSAPAHITRYPRGKSRVQYLGRSTDGEHNARKKARALPNWTYTNNAAITPYAYYPPPATAIPYQGGYPTAWQGALQNPYQSPYIPAYMAPVPYAMLQAPFAQSLPDQQPAKNPASNLQRDFEAYRNKNPGVGTRDLFGNNKSRWAPIQAQPQSAREEFFGARAKTPVRHSSATGTLRSRVAEKPKEKQAEIGSARNSSSREEEKDNNDENDTEEVDLAIEEGAQPISMQGRQNSATSVANPTMQGEIRLQQDSFAFTFSMLDSATDKKMFMSICDKVWDEAQEISKR
ncbi:LAQU0S16e01332g1_1 [Lachancea quebecensis]|uniref:LAQU0S16e01332g1_1 n=1 Tax=Lachancea quebecensis TaxID=1654605 RepID=A0A0P1KWS5_9SACH|nr:LAQU0S16e01332g1_1 [Lachancea quebecensis]